MSLSARTSPAQPLVGETGSPTDWLTASRFATILGLLLAGTFAPVLSGVSALAYGDAGQFAYPVARYVRDSFWRGELPFWNPLNSCGVPFLAQWNTLALYPPSLLYLLLPMPWSFALFCVAHLFLAGMGMYVLARRWTGNNLAAGVAGAAFAFNGLTWYGLMWPHILAGLAWMPWVFLTAERAWREGRLQILVAAVITALQLLSGGAEVIVQTWLALLVFWVAALAQGRASPRLLVARFAGVGCLAAGLAAIQLFPFLDFLADSQRTVGYSNSGIGSIAPLPLSGWANYLVPLFHCARNWAGVFVQPQQSWVASYYLGIGIIALALAGAWLAQGTTARLLAALSVFGLLLAMGRQLPVYHLCQKVLPVLALIRFPVKFVILTGFALPLLAAYGLARLHAPSVESIRRELLKCLAVVLGVIAATAAIIFAAWRSPLPGEEPHQTALNGLVRLSFLLAISAVVYLLCNRVKHRHWIFQCLLLVLCWSDVLTHSSNLSPTVAPAALEPGAIRAYFQWKDELRPGVSRAMQSPAALMRMVSTGLPDPEADIRGRRLALLLNLNLLDDAAKFDGFYSLDLKPYQDLFSRVYFTTNEAGGLKDFLGISHVTNPTNLVDWVRRPSFLPIITGGQRPVFAPDEEALAGTLNTEFNARQTVYLPPNAEAQTGIQAWGPVQIHSLRFSAQKVSARIQSARGGMVVIAQCFYHCWRAYVDGAPVPLWRANYAFQALHVPAGEHQLTVRYEDRAFRWGASLTGFSSILICAAWFWWRNHSRPKSQPTSVGGPAGASGRS